MGTLLHTGMTYYVPKPIEEVMAILDTVKWLKLDRDSAVRHDRGAIDMYAYNIKLPRYIRTSRIHSLSEADPLDVLVCEDTLARKPGFTAVKVTHGLQNIRDKLAKEA